MNKKTYKALVKKTQDTIEQLQITARVALDQAVALSESTGVPFDWHGGKEVGGYIPSTVPQGLDPVFLEEVTGFDRYYFEKQDDDDYAEEMVGWLGSYC